MVYQFSGRPILPALPNLPEKKSFIPSLYEGYTYPLGRAKESRRAGAAVSRPKNGLQLFCQFNLCFSFFKLSIVYKNSFTTSV